MYYLLPILQPLLVTAILTIPQTAMAHPDLAEFETTAFTEEPSIVDCTLANGEQSTCYEITVNYLPEGLEIGPFCPGRLSDEGGIWNWTGENAKLYRIDENFLRMLDDLGYRFFDEDGTVHVVDIATQQPSVDHACINVSPAEDVTISMLLPVNPVTADQPTPLGTVGKVGVALNGVPIFSDAPSIQQTGHMPALDTCGGHIDPGGWYHWHATSTDIETTFEAANVEATCALEQRSSALFGYAFDGFAMYGSTDSDGTVPVDLDACNGHVGRTIRGADYHYHASEDFPNLPPCLTGVQATDNFSTTATVGIGATRAGEDGRNEPPRPDSGGQGPMPQAFDDAAAALGISIDTLMEALHSSGQGHPNLAVAAQTLGVTEDALRAVLPPPPGQ
jgi:hypothetical protein